MQSKFDAEGYVRAMERRDLEAVLEFFSDDVVAEDVSSPASLRGKAAVRAVLRPLLAAASNIQAHLDARVEQEAEVAVLVTVRVQFGRDLSLASGKSLPVAGMNADFRIAAFLRLNPEGRVMKITRIMDLGVVAEQLGIRREALQWQSDPHILSTAR